MSSHHPQPIHLVDLMSRHDKEVESGQVSQSWPEMAKILTRHDVRTSKDGPCFMPASMKPRSEWALSRPRPGAKSKPGYRNDGNIESVTMIVLDLDQEGAREKAEEAFDGLEYVLYSTHSYNEEAPHKFRLVMPITDPIPVEDWHLVFRALAYKVGADLQCSNVSRIFYYPSADPESEIPPVSRHQRGRILDPAPLIEEEKQLESYWIRPRKPSAHRPVITQPPRAPAPHFAGESHLPNPHNYRLSALERRHRTSIDRLKEDDSRHYFALSVTAREIARFGPRADLPRLVQFLFYGSQKYSSRELDSGNTLEEIPEMVASAWAKFKAQGSDVIDANIGPAIEEAVQRALEARQSQQWEFSDAPKAPLPDLTVETSTQAPVQFARSFVREGVRLFGADARLASLAKGCLDAIRPKDLKSVVAELVEAADTIRPEQGPWSEEQFRRFWRGALARAQRHYADTQSPPAPG